MRRSQKKDPFVANHLLRKIEKLIATKEKKVIETWSRASSINPTMIGHTLSIHNGKVHLPVYIRGRMLGFKLGDFVPTRNFERHEKNDNKSRR